MYIRYFGYCWLVGLVGGRDLGVLVMLVSTCA